MTITSEMPLVERLRKAANCVIFLDGAPEPAADVADMLRKAAELLVMAETALDNAECAIDADMNVEAFSIVQTTRKLLTAALGKP